MKSRKNDQQQSRAPFDMDRSQPVLHQRAGEIQAFEAILPEMPLGLSVETREKMVQRLNPILADTMTLRDLYKKSHWQVSGPTFYQLHLLFDKHHGEQTEL